MYNDKNFKTAHPLTFGLAMVAGIGVILMILALGFGVLQADADTNVIRLVFVGGLAMLITGVVAWIFIIRPFEHFDDINQPLEDDHGHGHAAPQIEVLHDEQGHAITVVDDSGAVEVRGTGHH